MTRASPGGFLRGLPPDPWYTPTIDQHPLEKKLFGAARAATEAQTSLEICREVVVLLVSANLRMERRLKLLTTRVRERMEGNRPAEPPCQIVPKSKPPM